MTIIRTRRMMVLGNEMVLGSEMGVAALEREVLVGRLQALLFLASRSKMRVVTVLRRELCPHTSSTCTSFSGRAEPQ
jgi:hypothetical protein